MSRTDLLRLEFIVEGSPISQQTRRRERLRAWQSRVREKAESQWSENFRTATEDVLLQIVYFYKETVLDVDNIVKPIQDAMIGLAYLDDVQVTDILVRKRDLLKNLIIRDESLTPVLIEGLTTEDEFIHMVITDDFDQEI